MSKIRKRKWTSAEGEPKEAWIADYTDNKGRHNRTFKREMTRVSKCQMTYNSAIGDMGRSVIRRSDATDSLGSRALPATQGSPQPWPSSRTRLQTKLEPA